MKKSLFWCVAALAFPLTSQPADGQAIERTPGAALEDLRAHGRPTDSRLFQFQGCPQDDPAGRAVFDAVRGERLGSSASVRLLMIVVRDKYPSCDYAPLNAWVVQTVDRWHSAADWDALWHFASGLQQLEIEIPIDLQEALFRAAEDGGAGPTAVRAAIADAALRFRPPARQVQEGIAALARTIPDRTKTSWTYHLSRTFGSEFFLALAGVAPTFTDEQLFVVASAISTDVRNGRVPADAAGLPELRAEIRGRPGLPPWAQIETEAVIVPHSDQPSGR